MERLRHNHPDDTSELLSAFVDDQVGLVERRRAEALIERCAACAHEVRELRMFRDLLHDLPTIQPQRSFTLDPVAVRPRRLLFPTLRWATAITALLLFIVLGADFAGTLGTGGDTAASGAAPAAAPGGSDQFRALEFQESGDPAGTAPLMERAAASEEAEASAGAAAEAENESIEALAAPSVAAKEEAESAEASEAASAPSPEASAAALLTAQAGAEAAQASAAADPQALVATPESAFDAAGTAASPDAASLANQPAAVDHLHADPPAAADTVDLPATAQAPARSWSTLRIAQIVLALALVAFGAAAFWTWRRQI